MSDIPSFPYRLLWGERTLASVANLTRADGREFIETAVAAGVRCKVRPYPLEQANQALDDLRAGEHPGHRGAGALSARPARADASGKLDPGQSVPCRTPQH
ncbi:hypothetical protein [Achromobacter sp. DMS1]|uniref:hypothetical protein n=1 Tax=Achromobacter sp. DMS1 TaxID=1688405 RepID=UPI00350FE5B4